MSEDFTAIQIFRLMAAVKVQRHSLFPERIQPKPGQHPITISTVVDIFKGVTHQLNDYIRADVGLSYAHSTAEKSTR
jgi:hypothetical protein